MSDHPSAEALAAAAEGRDALAAAHVASCPACAARVADYRAALGVLAAASPASRSYCPPREELARPTVAASLRAHLEACPWCACDRRDWEVLDAAPGPAAALQGAVAWALDAAAGTLRLLSATLPPAPVPALAAARGGAEASPPVGVQAVFGAGVVTVAAAARRGGVDVRVTASERAPRPFRIEVRDAEGRPLESRSSDGAGAVVVTDLEPGAYRLLVSAPGEGGTALELTVDLASGFDKAEGGGYTEGGDSDGG